MKQRRLEPAELLRPPPSGVRNLWFRFWRFPRDKRHEYELVQLLLFCRKMFFCCFTEKNINARKLEKKKHTKPENGAATTEEDKMASSHL
ncbi:uncharacterized protein V6R79_002542 [Siganus canaliculatus]